MMKSGDYVFTFFFYSTDILNNLRKCSFSDFTNYKIFTNIYNIISKVTLKFYLKSFYYIYKINK